MKKYLANILILLVLITGCHSSKKMIEKGDELCIGNTFYSVKDVKFYPWVRLSFQKRCVREGMRSVDTLINIENVKEIEIGCICRWSYKCQEYCDISSLLKRGEFRDRNSEQECLDTCKLE